MSVFEFLLDADGDLDFDDADEDISAYVMSQSNVTCSRGKDAATSFASPAAGTYNALVLNVDKRFSPGYTLSPYYNIRMAGKRVRWLTTGSAGEGFDLIGGDDFELIGGGSLDLTGAPKRVIWTGRLQRFLQHPEKDQRTVEMPSLSMLSRLVGKNVSTQVYQGITTSAAISVILDLAGWPADERIISTGQTVLTWWWWDSTMGDAFQAIVALLQSEGPGASVYDNASGYFVFEDRDYRTTTSRCTIPQATYTDMDSRVQPPFEYDENEQNVIEACAITIEEREAQPLSQIWSLGEELVLAPNEVWKRRFVTSDPFINAQVPSPIAGNTIFTLTGSHPLIAGTFKLEYLGVRTSSLAYNVTAGAAETALEDLYGAGNVSCSGGPLNVAPIFCELINEYAELNITTFPTVVDSTLNPVSIPGGITVEEIFPGGAGFIERQRLSPAGVLVSGTWAAEITFDAATHQTADLAYDATAQDIADAFAAIFNLEDTTAFHGPINTTPVEVNFIQITLENIENVIIIQDPLDPLMMQTPGATVDIAVSQAGGIADYVVVAGGVASITLDRITGKAATVIVEADGTGLTLTGLRTRGQSVIVVRSDEVLYPEDTDERIADGEDIKVFRPAALSGVTRATAEIITMLFVLFYLNPRPSIVLTIINSIYKAEMDGELQREVSDLIALSLDQLGIVNENYFVEKKNVDLVGTRLITTLHCEKALAA